jgi:hypothetical protein
VLAFSCTRIVKLLVAAGSDVMLKNAFKRTPLQHFNQDAEQQKAAEKEKVQQQPQQANAANVPSASSEVPPSSPGEVRMTPAQLDALEEDIAQFQRNLTEAGIALQQ